MTTTEKPIVFQAIFVAAILSTLHFTGLMDSGVARILAATLWFVVSLAQYFFIVCSGKSEENGTNEYQHGPCDAKSRR